MDSITIKEFDNLSVDKIIEIRDFIVLQKTEGNFRWRKETLDHFKDINYYIIDKINSNYVASELSSDSKSELKEIVKYNLISLYEKTYLHREFKTSLSVLETFIKLFGLAEAEQLIISNKWEVSYGDEEDIIITDESTN